MMSTIIRLLAALSWPLAALIAGTALIHACRLLVDLAESCRQSAEVWRKTWREVETIRIAHEDNRVNWQRLDSADPIRLLRESCERVLLAVIQTNGGFPGSPSDDVGRQLVREVRKMYAELERPTPARPQSDNRAQARAEDLTDDELADLQSDDTDDFEEKAQLHQEREVR
jgi:hypothetical protein